MLRIASGIWSSEVNVSYYNYYPLGSNLSFYHHIYKTFFLFLYQIFPKPVSPFIASLTQSKKTSKKWDLDDLIHLERDINHIHNFSKEWKILPDQ